MGCNLQVLAGRTRVDQHDYLGLPGKPQQACQSAKDLSRFTTTCLTSPGRKQTDPDLVSPT